MGKTSSLISFIPFLGLSSFRVLKAFNLFGYCIHRVIDSFSKNVTRVTLREQLDGLTILLLLDTFTSRELFIVWR
ncbi:MAG: hypothetical protein HXS48_03120 [Theionarchaea archaeon]|nr:hypothetical protein [Theionarchaea archaeon]